MSEARRLLESIDWNFGNIPVSTGVHAIHPYPAKFIAQIPKTLIQLFHPDNGTILLDPFCGSGTTLVEGIFAGIDVVGIDLHPLACLISKVKTTPLSLVLAPNVDYVVQEARKRFLAHKFTVPVIPNLNHWFREDVQKALASLISVIQEEKDEEIRNALEIALSSIIVRVSNQDSDTRYAAVVKDVSASQVFNQFYQAANSISKALETLSNNILTPLGKAQIINKDILKVTKEDLSRNVGLVITSPPYPNAYEYWLYHKYRMYWLGMNPLAVRASEIGARPHYFKTNPQNEHDFERQMQSCFELLSQIMVPSARACFLIGRSIIHGRVIDNVKLLQRAAKVHGFITESVIERLIPTTRKTFNPSHGKINREHLIVFSLQDGS